MKKTSASTETMVPTVRESQEKIKGSGKVEKFKSTRVQKLTKMQKKMLNFYTQHAYTFCQVDINFSVYPCTQTA